MKKYIIKIFICLYCINSNVAGQIFNTSIIHVEEDGLITSGTFFNEGFVQNQGELYVAGNWVNHNIYQGNGTIELKGSEEQIFSHNSQTVGKLIFNSPGKKIIKGFTTIDNALELLEGIGLVGNEDVLLLKPSAKIVGGSEISYIEGKLTHAGTGFKFYPIGRNGIYSPVELIDISGYKPVTALEAIEVVPDLVVPDSIGVFKDLYWKRTQISGEFYESPVSVSLEREEINFQYPVVLYGDKLNQNINFTTDITVETFSEMTKVSTAKPIAGSYYFIGQTLEEVVPKAQFYFPTTLSPNAMDENNRLVKIYGEGFLPDDFIFCIYDRRGIKIYESRSLEHMQTIGWDGKQNAGNKTLGNGIYPYVLRVRNIAGEIIKKTGYITIIN